MHDEALRVATAHLRELAAKQGQAAVELVSAAELVSGVDSRIRVSHGVIALSCASAVETVERTRRTAARGIAQRSSTLSSALVGAAERYQATDDVSGSALDRQVVPQSRRPR
ncbi:ESX-1 secretion-associated protein [Mycobacterium sp. SMC-4]|uniref:ESX-1 secretion-associated protein n=1 Tax=Mycobacterium sp. SMC-4 TaxID=2857059 RepID=UPI0021B333CB|nr:ESX-1 secretion-associated protein [Mycobacterium sp. SMC-4]UXA18228.1 ESX-1 secretion-associated protein [Mycobacterium sp. SMC-4]